MVAQQPLLVLHCHLYFLVTDLNELAEYIENDDMHGLTLKDLK